MPELPGKDMIELTLAAARLRKDYQTARTMLFRGELTGQRIGRRWYVTLASVERIEVQAREMLAQPA